MSDEAPRIRLTDPRAMRAYAHPLRLKLVGLLRKGGPHTATQAAAALGDTVPNCSFHLRQLAKYGLVERAAAADGRERPWRATAMTTSWDDSGRDPATSAAADHLTATIITGYFDLAQAWLDRRAAESAEWREVTGIGDQTLYVTSDELTDIHAKLDEILEAYRPRQSDPSARPEGSRPINMIRLTLPWDPR